MSTTALPASAPPPVSSSAHAESRDGCDKCHVADASGHDRIRFVVPAMHASTSVPLASRRHAAIHAGAATGAIAPGPWLAAGTTRATTAPMPSKHAIRIAPAVSSHRGADSSGLPRSSAICCAAALKQSSWKDAGASLYTFAIAAGVHDLDGSLDAIEVCRGVDEAWAATCFDSLGRQTVSVRLYEPDLDLARVVSLG